MKLSKYRQRFPTDFDPALEKSNHLETVRRETELEAADEVKFVVLNNEADLTEVEKTVIHHRFGIDLPDDQEPLTLEQVGQIIGVTKERVRQIQNKGARKDPPRPRSQPRRGRRRGKRRRAGRGIIARTP